MPSRVTAAFAGVAPEYLKQVLIGELDADESTGVGWRHDKDMFMAIIGTSLSSVTTFCFRS